VNQSNNQPQSLLDALINDILDEMPIEDMVRFANLAEDEIEVLEAVLSKLITYRLEKLDDGVNEDLLQECIGGSGDKSLDKAEAATFILKQLWKRLRDTHKLGVVEKPI
jgi:hypothetical protein